MIKKVIYSAAMGGMRFLWRLRGFRKVRAFGEGFCLTAGTIFPTSWRMRLPREGYASDIVRYADNVQFHAVVRLVSESPAPPVILEVGAHHGAYAVVLGKIARKAGGRVIAV